MEKLPSLGERVISLEQDITQKQIHQLGLMSRDIAKGISKYLNKAYPDWPYDIQIGNILLSSIRRVVFPVIYKYYLLLRWLQKIKMFSELEQGYVVGCKSLIKNPFLLGRFDTVFAILADQLEIPSKVKIVECPEFDGKMLVEEMENVGTGAMSRLLMLLNMNFGMTGFRIWNYLFKFRDVSLPFIKNELNVLFYDNCELVEESFAYFFLKRCRLVSLKRIEANILRKQKDFYQDVRIDKEELEHIFIECVEANGELATILNPSIKELMEFISKFLERGVKKCLNEVGGLKSILVEIERLKRSGEKNGFAVVTTEIPSPKQRMMHRALKTHGIPMYAFDHGITKGISYMSETWVEENAMCVSEAGLCYNSHSCDYHNRSCNGLSKGIVVGMPSTNKKLRFRKLQRNILRTLFNVPIKKRVIVYVANLYFNNFIYSPGACCDTYYHNLKKSLVFDVLGKLEDYCLLKLYPTHRYLDPDPFANLIDVPKNVKVIQFFEYRYLRAIGDIVMCDSPQSTLGWVWSARIPLIFLDLPSNPLLPEISADFEKSIFKIDCSKDDWRDEVKKLLLISHEELIKKWEMKGKFRKGVEERYIFGPGGNAGRRAAKYVMEGARKGFAGTDLSYCER